MFRGQPPVKLKRGSSSGVRSVERLESRSLLSTTGPAPLLTSLDVTTLLSRAAEITPDDSAIVAVVDRQGRPLGVRVEGNVSTSITGNPETLVYAVDGALAEARTAAMFSTDQAAVTSRTAQNLAQSTITRREVQSDPNISDPNSTARGPGYVAPIGANAHFPAGIKFTPEVGPFQIEQTNRDSIVSPGPDHLRGTSDDIPLTSRFNVPLGFIPNGQQLAPPESYGFLTGLLPSAQSRGLGTLPGGIPIYENHTLVGGIGVFFPGLIGQATEENSRLNDSASFDLTKPDLAQVAEYVAFVAAGGSRASGFSFNTSSQNAALGLTPLPSSFDLPFDRIDVNGITLDIYGTPGLEGPGQLVGFGSKLARGVANSGLPDRPVDVQGDTSMSGQAVPTGWLVTPHGSADGSLSASDVTGIIRRGIAGAGRTRSGIRLPLNSPSAMVFAVADRTGAVMGLYRMPDAQDSAIDEVVAKARNVAYYDDPAQLQPADRVTNLSVGVAFTTRTIRYLSGPRFPEGIDGQPPGPFSILNETAVDGSRTPEPASMFQTVQGFASFNPQSNFHDPNNVANQNGVVFSPGSAPLDKTLAGKRVLVGGLGVGGDLPDQNDTVTARAEVGYEPPNQQRADQSKVRGVRLPYQKFNRHPSLPG